MEIAAIGRDIVVNRVDCLDLVRTLDCGQAFRWSQTEDGRWHGVVRGTALAISQEGDRITFYGTTRAVFDRIWALYFDLGRNYPQMVARLCEDPVLARAVREHRGIRILRQEPWEALCSFIISQNNNIPRIKGIIARLCEYFGERAVGGGFAFPGPERLAPLEPEDLAVLRAGFRARYIIDAARKVSDGTVPLDGLDYLPIDEARARLMQITGVGIKVADCTLLYGAGRLEICPMDVWMKRVIAAFYPQGMPPCTAGLEGVAQQYLFHYARTSGVLSAG